MLDNQLIQIFRPIIITGLAAVGLGSVPVKQAFQPTQQGAEIGPAIYFYKTGDVRYGFLDRHYTYNSLAGLESLTETQWMETTFRVEALVKQNPETPNQYTASDLVNEVAAIMQNTETINILNASDVGILRVSGVENAYFVDDKDQFEASPVFEFVLSHKQIRVSAAQKISNVICDLNAVK